MLTVQYHAHLCMLCQLIQRAKQDNQQFFANNPYVAQELGKETLTQIKGSGRGEEDYQSNLISHAQSLQHYDVCASSCAALERIT